jgi:nucleoside-diphosphate-sugar epimerase
LRIKVARIFNTYGPRMHPHDGRVVSNFIIQALLGRDITIYGDGSQTRSFCYVDDLIDGLVRLMGSPDEVVGPINIGNPVEFSMLQLANVGLALTHRPSAVAAGRSATTPAGHFQSAGNPRLEARHAAQRRAGEDDHLFRSPAARARDDRHC